MPPQTRSSTRTTGVQTRASSAQTLSSKKAEAPKVYSESKRKANLKATPKPKRKSKSEPKSRATPKLETEPEPAPARKRVRRSGPKHDAQANKASGTTLLINMPVEVLIEIARYVHPLDLIMLSRVNKFFRDLFMDKRSAMIWRSARENLPGLPSRPEDVSEPQYAAMLFAKRCSTCGGYAPREMNPVLLVRLCSHCWEEELVDVSRVTDASLVLSIGGPIPGQSRSWRLWCLYKEARAVKVQLNELQEAGDEEALQLWKEERHKFVEAKKKNAEPLSRWLVNRERERARVRNDLKVVHRKEIEARLIKLGWEQGDFQCYDRWRRKQWDSMVQTTKVLTDKVWDNLLPRLLGHLELNRDQRLERERAQRRSARSRAIYTWFEATRGQLPAFAQALPVDGSNSDAGQASSTSSGIWHGYIHDNPKLLLQAFPAVAQAQEWPEYMALIDNDMPHEQFLDDFEGKKPEFQRSITEWRDKLEAHLIAALPDNTQPPNFDASSSFTMRVGASENGQPLNTLPQDIQKLLRADVVFTSEPVNDYSAPSFYPHTFQNSLAKIPKLICYTKAQEIAQALLKVLGTPDASYLSLKALGKVFRCGRCPQAFVTGQSWDSIIYHYIDSIRQWKVNSRTRQVKSNKDFVYVCVHDIDVDNPDRPLVRVSTEVTPADHHPWSSSSCLLCEGVGLGYRMRSQIVADHVRDVHLVEEPEAGVHYRDY